MTTDTLPTEVAEETVIEKIGDYLDEHVIQPVTEFFKTDVEPVLMEFAKQFESDFGKIAFDAAAAAVATLIPGAGFDIVAMAEGLLPTLLHEGLAIAEADAKNVLMNALRVHYSVAVSTVTPTA